MYTQFYGLREKPFSLSPDPRYLFLSDSHREALAHLLYGIEQGEGFIAITGEVGTGKTTLCRTLLQRVEPGTEIAFIFNPQLSGLELLQAINAELGLETESRSRRELTEQLNRFLLARKAEGRRVLLILDEAQNLEPDALEQVRLLSNLETDTEKLIQIILIGQPELDAMLESPRLRQLRQRISVRWRLRPLSVGDAREYVRHRLKIAAGGPRELFSELALREIHRRSGGIPRLINLLCDRALLAGYAAGAHTIGLGLVAQTDREVERGASGGLGPVARRTPSWLRESLGGRRVAVWAAAALALVLVGVALGVGARRLGGGPGDGAAMGAAAGPPAESAAVAAAPPATAEASTASPAEAGSAPAAAEPEAPDDAAPVVQARIAPSAGEPDPTPAAEDETVEDLGRVLARRSPAATAADALDGLLTSWGEAKYGAELLSVEQVLQGLAAAGLRAEPVETPSVESTLAWDLPLLLELRALDGLPRPVGLVAVEGDAVRVHGLGPEPRRVRREALAAHLGTRGWVVWRDAAELPRIIRPGSPTEAVDWLQGALAVLDLYRGPASGVYDAETIAGVRTFQEREGLVVDGTVGPRTRARIFARLPTLTLPRLGVETLAEASP